MNHKDSFLNGVFESAVYAIVLIDHQGIIQQINPAAEALFLYTPEDMVGENITKLMPPEVVEGHEDYISTYIKTKEKKIIGKGQEVCAIRKDGKHIDIFLSVSDITFEEKQYFAGIMHEVSERKRMEEESEKLYAFYNEMMSGISHVDDYSSLISKILECFVQAYHFDMAHYYEYNKHEDRLESSDLFSMRDKDKFKLFIDITKKTTFGFGEGLPGTAWKQQGMVNYPNIYKSHNFPRAKHCKHLNLKGGVGIPIFIDKQVIGVVELYSTDQIILTNNEKTQFDKLQTILTSYYKFFNENRNLKLIFNAAGEGIYGLDLEGNATFINPAACQILGYKADELIGVNMHDKVHYNYPDGEPYSKEDCYMSAAFMHGKSYHIVNEVLWCKNGRAVEIEYTSTPIYENKKIVGAVITFIDVSIEARFRHIINEIAKIQEKYISGESKRPLFEYVLQYLIKLTESEFGFIGGIISKPGEAPYLKSYAITNLAWDDKSKKLYEESIEEGLEFRNLNSLFGHTITTGESVISNDPNSDKRSGGVPKGHPKLSSFLGVPIYGSGGLIGMFGLANKKEGYNPSILNELKPITNMLSSILDSINTSEIIANMAKIDTLTGLYNRNYFERKLNDVIAKHKHEQKIFAIMILDLSSFKKVNDLYGHQSGDVILYQFSNRIKSIVKQSDFVARIGGDEFCIILGEINDIENTKEIAKRIIASSLKPYEVCNKEILCKSSIGIATYPDSGESPDILLKHLDFALYEAKQKEARFEVYSDLLEEKYLEHNKMEEDIRGAFQRDEFYLVFQPQIDTGKKHIHGIEILLRWAHPEKGTIAPSTFIPMIEKMKEANRLNVYLIKKCIHEIQQLNPDHPLVISLNLSPYIENLPAHLLELIDLISDKSFNKNITLEFELTESSFISNSDEFEKELAYAMKAVKKAGIRFAIDDFGVEYSSINRLIDYQFDTIKIDMIFVHKLSTPDAASASAIIKAILGLSRDLGFDVVAEGAETEDQIHALNILGCRIIQGFHFYGPLSADKMQEIINIEPKVN